jgi:transposase
MVEATFEMVLKLTHIRVLRVEQTKAGAYIVTVESTLDHTTCHICKRRIDTFYRLDDWIMLQHLPICGSKVFVRLQPKRFRCAYRSGETTTTRKCRGIVRAVCLRGPMKNISSCNASIVPLKL